VLVIVSAGWAFDAFEGQIFNVTRDQMFADLPGVSSGDPAILYWGDVFLGVFLAGGTVGGLLFGWLGDRWGRRPAMILSILFYSVFSGLTYFVTDVWQVGGLRFLVAMGVGGEWAVAAALVAEVMPPSARAHMFGIFHSTSILGAFLAAWAGLAVGGNWRPAFLLGVLPALGAGFCFNGGRLVAGAALLFSGWLKALSGMDLRLAIALMALLFPLGADRSQPVARN